LYDVVVVGAGPAGNQVAYRLALLGYRVVVLERNHLPGKKVCCTGIIGEECAASFAIDDSVVLRHVNSATLFSPSGNSMQLRRREPQACILDRSAFDVMMAARAQEAGAEYVLDCQVGNVTINDDGVRAEAGGKNFEAKAAVLACGFGSGLSERLGLGRAGDFVTGAQAEVATVGIDEVKVYFGSEIAPGFFAWLVPTTPARGRVGLLSRRNPGMYLSKLIVALQAQEKVAPGEVELSYGAIPLKPLAKTYAERLLVVGDAAGQVKPTTGGGIYYGLLCADIAANTLHQAFQHGDFSAKRMEGYQRNWGKLLKRELKIGYWARRLFERLSNAQIDRLIDIIRSSGIDEEMLQAKELSFDWHGKAILRLLGFKTVSRIIKVIKVPFRST